MAAPGWYPNPNGDRSTEAFWDGMRWTATRPLQLSPPAPVMQSEGARITKNVLLVLGAMAAAGWFFMWVGDPTVDGINCDKLDQIPYNYVAACDQAASSYHTGTGLLALLAAILFVVAYTIQRSTRRR